jgi:4-amino-4-deoxy-L-arabinose transferase-like glycosyltransferase
VRRRIHVLWISIAALLTLIGWCCTLSNPFASEEHAWASAHMALLARSFAQLGIVGLHGVPIQNNLPLGLQPDRYVHWPPLYPMLLSVGFRVFGESETVVHAFVIAINVWYLATFYFLAKRCLDGTTAILSVFALLTIPVFVQQGTMAWTPDAAMAAVIAALYCFVRGTEGRLNWKWISAGSLAVAFGVLFSWEATPLGLILLGFGTWQRSRTRQFAAAIYAAAGAGAMAMVLVLLVSSSPELRNDLWGTVVYRMGGAYHPTNIPIHAWADHVLYNRHITVKDWVTTVVIDRGPLLGGVLGLLATMGLFAWSWNNRKSRPDVFYCVGGLAGVAAVWVALFPNHVFIHNYQALIAAPVVCIGFGLAMKAGVDRLRGRLGWLAIWIVPLILLVPLIGQTVQGFRKVPPAEILKYARDIEGSTNASAVVLSPLLTMVPVYYSHRHIIRAVDDDEALRSVARQARATFPDSGLYIAIPPDSLGRFSCAYSRFPLVKRTSSMILLKVDDDACQPEMLRSATLPR